MTLLAKAVTAPAEINCTRFTEKISFFLQFVDGIVYSYIATR